MLQKRRGERTVLASAVVSGGTSLCREGNQGVRLAWLHTRETASQRTARNGAFHRPCERIVAARIENDEAQPLCGLDRLQHAIQRDRLVVGIAVLFKRSIDRNEIVHPVHFDTVACVVDDRHVGVAALVREVAQRSAHLCIRQVALRLNDLEVPPAATARQLPPRHWPDWSALRRSCTPSCRSPAQRACRPKPGRKRSSAINRVLKPPASACAPCRVLQLGHAYQLRPIPPNDGQIRQQQVVNT